MRNFKVVDAFIIALFSHVFGFFFGLVLVVEKNKHNCANIGYANGLVLAYTGLCIIVFSGLTYREWRIERQQIMENNPPGYDTISINEDEEEL